MTMAISKAKEKGCKVVMCASTGNTSASAAAYAAASGTMKCVVLIPEGNIATINSIVEKIDRAAERSACLPKLWMRRRWSI